MHHEMDVAASHLGGMDHEKMKPMKEFHVRELHDGYHITRHHGDGHTTEHVAHSLVHAHAHMEHHMGTPNKGEEEMEGGTGSKAEEKAEGEKY